jgi:hypothetical protein
VTAVEGDGGGHPAKAAKDAAALEVIELAQNDRPLGKTSRTEAQASVDQLTADLIPYGDVIDRLPALQRVERAFAAPRRSMRSSISMTLRSRWPPMRARPTIGNVKPTPLKSA